MRTGPVRIRKSPQQLLQILKRKNEQGGALSVEEQSHMYESK
jgi:hypothetical protein